MIKFKIISGLTVLIIILCFVFSFLYVYKHKESFDINVKVVDEIQSDLYTKVKFYNYNDVLGKVTIEEKYIRNENVIYEIFNYYNMNSNLRIVSYLKENDILLLELNDIFHDEITLKKMKLSYHCLNIENIQIN